MRASPRVRISATAGLQRSPCGVDCGREKRERCRHCGRHGDPCIHQRNFLVLEVKGQQYKRQPDARLRARFISSAAPSEHVPIRGGHVAK